MELFFSRNDIVSDMVRTPWEWFFMGPALPLDVPDAFYRIFFLDT